MLIAGDSRQAWTLQAVDGWRVQDLLDANDAKDGESNRAQVGVNRAGAEWNLNDGAVEILAPSQRRPLKNADTALRPLSCSSAATG